MTLSDGCRPRAGPGAGHTTSGGGESEEEEGGEQAGGRGIQEAAGNP